MKLSCLFSFSFHTDPHIKVTGKLGNVASAKDKIMSVLDTKVSFKLWVKMSQYSQGPIQLCSQGSFQFFYFHIPLQHKFSTVHLIDICHFYCHHHMFSITCTRSDIVHVWASCVCLLCTFTGYRNHWFNNE